MQKTCCEESPRGLTAEAIAIGLQSGILSNDQPIGCMQCGRVYWYRNGELVFANLIVPEHIRAAVREATEATTELRTDLFTLADTMNGFIPCSFCGRDLFNGCTMADREHFVTVANFFLHANPRLSKQEYLDRIASDDSGMRTCKPCFRVHRQAQSKASLN